MKSFLKSEYAGVWLAGVAALGFAMKAIFVKMAYPYGVSAPTLLALRMLFSLPVFAWVAIAHSRAASSLTRFDVGMLVMLGVLGYYGTSILDFIGLQYISAGLERLILFIYPTLTVLIGVFFMGRAWSSREGWAMALSYGGIALAVAHDLHFAASWHRVLIGAGFVFVSAVCFAVYLCGSGKMIKRLGSMRFTGLAMLVSTGATLLHFVLSRPLGDIVQPAPVMWLGAAIALFSTVLPVFMQSMAIQRIGASRAALIGSVAPVLTIFLGWLMLGEPITSLQLFSTVLVLAGVKLASTPPAKAEEEKSLQLRAA